MRFLDLERAQERTTGVRTIQSSP